jgi:hypothetical protein
MGREEGQTMAQEEGTHPTMILAWNQTHGTQWQMIRVIIRNDIADIAIDHICNYQ